MLLRVGPKTLASEFEISPTETPGASFAVVLESKNGQGRNPDYFQALEQLLKILGSNGCRIVEIQLVSKEAMKFPLSERILPLRYPIVLSGIEDFARLRKDICKAQASIITKAKSGRGNSHQRICLAISSGISGEQLLGNSSIHVV